MRNRLSFFIIMQLFAVAILQGCGGTGKENQADDAKKAYAEPWNEVEVVVLERQDFKYQLISNGKLSSSSKSALSFETLGTIADIRVSNGDWVDKGDTIAVLDRSLRSIELRSAEIELERCRIEMQDIIAGYGYTTGGNEVPENIKKMAGIKSGYLSAENSFARASHEYAACVMTAPFSGRVADIKSRVYDNAPSDVFCNLIDDNRFNVDFSILESEYPFIEKGLEVKVIPFGGGMQDVFNGRIASINPKVDKNGQIAITAVMENNGGRLIDGMNVKVIVEKDIPGQIVVPKSAVVIRDNLEVLFTYSCGEAHWTYVNTLMSNSDTYSVEANENRYASLAPGDTVIVSGNLNLADGSKVVIKD